LGRTRVSNRRRFGLLNDLKPGRITALQCLKMTRRGNERVELSTTFAWIFMPLLSFSDIKRFRISTTSHHETTQWVRVIQFNGGSNQYIILSRFYICGENVGRQ
jgi:hypothetical protein